jgi:hypothetical protein
MLFFWAVKTQNSNSSPSEPKISRTGSFLQTPAAEETLQCNEFNTIQLSFGLGHFSVIKNGLLT